MVVVVVVVVVRFVFRQLSGVVVLGCPIVVAFALMGVSSAGGTTTSRFTIWTIAGNGTACARSTRSCGDGPTATSANLHLPQRVAVDASGNVYIADSDDGKVRKVTPGGAISTIAGNGTECATATGPCGDGPTATTASITKPWGVAVDASGDVCIGDTEDHKIRWLTQAAPAAFGLLEAYQVTTSASRVLVRYAMTYPASVTLRVKPPKGPTVMVARASARAGLDQLAWNRKLHGKRAPHGSYRLTIAATSQGRTTTSALTVRLR